MRDHQLRERRLRRHVPCADGPGAARRDAALVPRQVDRAARRLAHDHHGHVALARRLEHGDERVLEVRDVAGAEGLDHHPLHPGRERAVQEARLQAGEGPHRDDARLQARVEGLRGPGQEDVRRDVDAQAELGEGRARRRAERAHPPRVDLGGAAAAEEPRVEGDADLGDAQRGEVAGVDEVGAGVRAHVPERALRAGERDGAVEARQEERERAGGVRHGVGAVYDDEAVVVGQRLVHRGGELDPVVRLHVARVEVEEDLRLDVGDLPEDGELRQDVALVGVGRERSGAATRHHEGAAGVDQEQAHRAGSVVGSAPGANAHMV